MKSNNYRALKKALICRKSILQVYEAYYSEAKWGFHRRFLALLLAAYYICKTITKAILFHKHQQDYFQSKTYIFVSSGNYVSNDFEDFLNSSAPQLRRSIAVEYINSTRFSKHAGLSKNEWNETLLILCYFFVKMHKEFISGEKSFYTSYLVLKHYQADLFPELTKSYRGEISRSLIYLLTSDEANPRFQAWYRFSGYHASSFIKLVHIQHGLVSERSKELYESVADVFLVLSDKTKLRIKRRFGNTKKVFVTGPYVRQSSPKGLSINSNRQLLLLLQPYNDKFGTKKEYRSMLRYISQVARRDNANKWLIRMHPVQTDKKLLKRLFNTPNCHFENTQELNLQISTCSLAVSFFSQTCYEVIAQHKPLFLIRSIKMNISVSFDQEFDSHLIDIENLATKINNFDFAHETIKSEATSNSKNLSIVGYSKEQVQLSLLELITNKQGPFYDVK